MRIKDPVHVPILCLILHDDAYVFLVTAQNVLSLACHSNFLTMVPSFLMA